MNVTNWLFAVTEFLSWLMKSTADGKIDAAEWTQLGLLIAKHTGLPTTLVLPKADPPPEEVTQTPGSVTDQDPPVDTGKEARAPPAENVSPKLAGVDK